MAGAILLSNGIAVSLSGPAFRHIADALRGPLLEVIDTNLVQALYEAYDGGLEIISTEGLDKESFAAFRTIVERASSESDTEYFATAWSMLLNKVRLDPRASS